MDTSVLLIAFNRPETTGAVLAAIREARPAALYVAQDGPRAGSTNDEQRCRAVRDLIEQAVDWPCRVRTLYRERNLGCRVGPAHAIDWFFRHEPEGIILEDDVVPSRAFFPYCMSALEQYRGDKTIWHIGGNNFSAPERLFEADAMTISLPQVWGWATWRDRWARFVENPLQIVPRWRRWRISTIARVRKLAHLERLRQGLDAWDYQWQLAVLNAGGRAVVPRRNLISNIGDGEDATHTKGADPRLWLKQAEEFDFTLPESPPFSRQLTRFFERSMGMARPGKRDLPIIGKPIVQRAARAPKHWTSRMLFRNTPRIVVASTGRAGSTLLYEAVVSAWLRQRYGSAQGKRRALAEHLCSGWANDLDTLDGHWAPLLKTHALPPTKPDHRSPHRIVFVYGDPIEAAFSVMRVTSERGITWFDRHQRHLQSHGSYGWILERDVLGFQNQMAAWKRYRRSGGNVLMIDYEDLWDRIDEISAYLDLNIMLEPRRPRAAKMADGPMSPELRAALIAAYGRPGCRRERTCYGEK